MRPEHPDRAILAGRRHDLRRAPARHGGEGCAAGTDHRPAAVVRWPVAAPLLPAKYCSAQVWQRIQVCDWWTGGLGNLSVRPEDPPFFPAASRRAFLLPQMRRWLSGSICSNALTGLTMSDTAMTWRSGWPDMSVARSVGTRQRAAPWGVSSRRTVRLVMQRGVRNGRSKAGVARRSRR